MHDDSPCAAFDATRPNPWRVHDYLLGGKDNYAADREAAETLAADADHAGLAQVNRAFLLKAAGWAAAVLGIRQFLDAGCGLPRRPSLHETVREVAPDAVVAYACADPVALSHMRALQGGEGITVIARRERDPGSVLGQLGGVLDLSEPVAVLMGGILSWMPAETARTVTEAYADALAPGSCMILSCARYADAGVAERVAAAFRPGAVFANHPRRDVESFFDAAGLRLVHGRAMNVTCWPACATTEGPEADAAVLGGVGIKD